MTRLQSRNELDKEDLNVRNGQLLLEHICNGVWDPRITRVFAEVLQTEEVCQLKDEIHFVVLGFIDVFNELDHILVLYLLDTPHLPLQVFLPIPHLLPHQHIHKSHVLWMFSRPPGRTCAVEIMCCGCSRVLPGGHVLWKSCAVDVLVSSRSNSAALAAAASVSAIAPASASGKGLPPSLRELCRTSSPLIFTFEHAAHRRPPVS